VSLTADMVLAVARGDMDKAQVSMFIRTWSKPA